MEGIKGILSEIPFITFIPVLLFPIRVIRANPRQKISWFTSLVKLPNCGPPSWVVKQIGIVTE